MLNILLHAFPKELFGEPAVAEWSFVFYEGEIMGTGHCPEWTR